MSDERIRYSFAPRLSAEKMGVFLRASSREVVSGQRSRSGPRLNRKKVKGEKRLYHALMRSAFGRSED
jgi:hypothetical protein